MTETGFATPAFDHFSDFPIVKEKKEQSKGCQIIISVNLECVS